MNRPLTVTPATAPELAKKYGIKWDSYERSHAHQELEALKLMHNRLLITEIEDPKRSEEIQLHRFFIWNEITNRYYCGKDVRSFRAAIEGGYKVKVKARGLASQYQRFAGAVLS